MRAHAPLYPVPCALRPLYPVPTGPGIESRQHTVKAAESFASTHAHMHVAGSTL